MIKFKIKDIKVYNKYIYKIIKNKFFIKNYKILYKVKSINNELIYYLMMILIYHF